MVSLSPFRYNSSSQCKVNGHTATRQQIILPKEQVANPACCFFAVVYRPMGQEKGNAAFAAKRFEEAEELYTQAIALLG